jgi:hypothetical protein
MIGLALASIRACKNGIFAPGQFQGDPQYLQPNIQGRGAGKGHFAEPMSDVSARQRGSEEAHVIACPAPIIDMKLSILEYGEGQMSVF